MNNTAAADKPPAEPTEKPKNTGSLKILLFVIAAMGLLLIFRGLSVDAGDGNWFLRLSFEDDTDHWMVGPAIAVMVLFMPLTAITYLHYRLPRKREEFVEIQKALNKQGENPEIFSSAFEQEDSAADYSLPILFVSVISFLCFYILFVDKAAVLFNGAQWIVDDNRTFSEPTSRRNIVAIAMAFLGAYIWSIRYVFRRMMTLDLPPGAYYSVATRMIYSAFLAVVFQYVIAGVGGGVNNDLFATGNNQVVVTSFLIGIFPDRALTFIRDSTGRIFKEPESSADPLPLEMIEGISGFHKARLFELGIDSAQNLAHASLMELILKTPFKPRVLVDWMAQARLCLEFKGETNKIRGAGIRTILDLQDLVMEDEKSTDGDSKSRLEEVARISDVDVELIRTVHLVNKNEKSIDSLRHAYDVLHMV
ncbi:MAG: hypothetical protein ACYTGA_02545 [Planctomycetota bacterium]|jgi:hypothetical protein